MLPIQQKFIKYNYNTGRSGNSIKYLVIHDTGNTGKGANANSHYNYFNGGNRNSSAHYFVDDSNIVQLVSDANTSWHCGDGGGKYGITNSNSIGIEICINNDGNYDKAVSHTIDLTKYLMRKYNISINNVVRHYDASRKSCPNTMSANCWAKWNTFKSKLTATTSTTTSTSNLIKVQVGAFSSEANADALIAKLKALGISACKVK